ncbi:hypothetical protein [Paenibacillus wulumuqiensis]|uniref:hypothetical protein n=1 Tax=Paenibacillus wulumuqiensis TaxID=1567107 RepID=UPI000619A51B|nr:hypothetical protein [Paenibacillus wulumuqiensis]
MQKVLKMLYGMVIAAGIVALLWMVLGATAAFQGAVDLVETIILVGVGIPLTGLIIIALYDLLKIIVFVDRLRTIVPVMISVGILLFSFVGYISTSTVGWLTEKVSADETRITADGKYEYHLEIVNGTQRNSSERIYLKNRATGEEQTIKVPIGMGSAYSVAYTAGEEIGWITMKSTDQSNQYIVSTTDQIMPSREDPLKPIHFLVDVEQGTAIEMN